MKYRVYFSRTIQYYADVEARSPSGALAIVRHDAQGEYLDGYTYKGGNISFLIHHAEPAEDDSQEESK